MTDQKNLYNIETEKSDERKYPKTLYKYRQVDEHLIQMLEDGCLYLCPADKLDDVSDCAVDFDIEKLSDLSEDELFLAYFKMIKKLLFKHIPTKYAENLREIYKKAKEKGFKQLKLLEYVDGIENISLDDKKQLKKLLLIFNDRFNNRKNKEMFLNFFKQLVDIQSQVGVCSLTPIKNDYYMWDKYAYWQICIEYNLSHLSKKEEKLLFKVNYVKEKKFDPIELTLEETLESFFDAFSKIENKERIREKIIKIITTKNVEWAYQSEYRFIGNPRDYIYLPVKTVFYGENVERDIIEQIKKIGKEKSFKVLPISNNDYKEINEKRAIRTFFENCDDYHIDRFEEIHKDESPDFIVKGIGFEITGLLDEFDVNNGNDYRNFCDKVSDDVARKIGYEIGINFLLVNKNIKYNKIRENIVNEIVQLIKNETYKQGTFRCFNYIPGKNENNGAKYPILTKYCHAVYLAPSKGMYFARGKKVDDKLKIIQQRIDAKEKNLNSKVKRNVLLLVADIADETFINLETLKQSKHRLTFKEDSKFEHIYVISINNNKNGVLKIK